MKRLANRIPVGALVALTLACDLVVLIPLGHAAPPDQTWIAGLYDDADHDDVVRAVVAAVAVSPAAPPRATSSTAVEPGPRAAARRTPAPVTLIARLDRGPPSA